MNVSIFVDRRFLGAGTVKNGKICGFLGFFPSRNPEDTDMMLERIEAQISNPGSIPEPIIIHNREVTWAMSRL